LARAQRGIVEVMGTWPQPLSALLDTEVGGKTISSDVDFMQHRRFLISNDSNRHGLVSLFSSVRGSAILRALIADCATAAVAISAGGVCSASVLRCEAADGGPIETVAALREQPRKRSCSRLASGIGTRRLSAACSDDEQLGCSRRVWTAEDWRRDEALFGVRVRL